MQSLVRIAAAGLLLGGFLAGPAAGAPALPTPDHIVLVVMENHSFAEIMEEPQAPFLQELGRRGAVFEHSFAVEHPSQPNYYALFTGSTWDVHDDDYHALAQPTLAGQLKSINRSFVGYAESAAPRKHLPWESFEESSDLGKSFGRFPRDFAQLPTVSFVIPDNDDDMHDGPVRDGDTWLLRHLGAYADWCISHNSLLIVTFDEDDSAGDNRIPTIIYGDHVKPGRYADEINHYGILRTIQAMYGLPPLARSADELPITAIWQAE